MCSVVRTLDIHGGVMADASKSQKRAGARANTNGYKVSEVQNLFLRCYIAPQNAKAP